MIARDLKLSYSSGLKDFQVRAMQAIETGNDVFLIAATGTGKSLVQQAAFMFKKGAGKGKCTKPITLHITPLKFLMDGQVVALSGHVAACHLTPSSLDEKVKNGEYTNLYLSAETLFEESVLELLSQSKVYKQRLKFICIDENDCVSWASFREKWGCLGKRRTFSPNVQILVASATVAAWHHTLLVKSLKLRKVVLVRERPDRDNLKFSAVERPDDFKVLLDPVVSTLIDHGEQAPITLIFCNDADLKSCSAIRQRGQARRVRSSISTRCPAIHLGRHVSNQ